MSLIFSNLDVRELEGAYRQLINPFQFYDSLVGGVEVPAGFICDYESVPWIRGTSKRAGVGHDYFYRFDSIPVVSKEVADRIYLNLMKALRVGYCRRYIKYNAVKYFGAPSYHRLSVNSDLEEIKNANN